MEGQVMDPTYKPPFRVVVLDKAIESSSLLAAVLAVSAVFTLFIHLLDFCFNALAPLPPECWNTPACNFNGFWSNMASYPWIWVVEIPGAAFFYLTAHRLGLAFQQADSSAREDAARRVRERAEYAINFSEEDTLRRSS